MANPSLYECLEPGMVMPLGSYTFQRDEIIRFATKFDPQRFHLSEDGATDSHFESLCASGWHTASIWMRLNVLNGRDAMQKEAGHHGPQPKFGRSPGVRDIRWLAPVYVGDTITCSSTITGKRLTPKREGWAMLFSRGEAHNQDGVLVLRMDSAVTMPVADQT